MSSLIKELASGKIEYFKRYSFSFVAFLFNSGIALLWSIILLVIIVTIYNSKPLTHKWKTKTHNNKKLEFK